MMIFIVNCSIFFFFLGNYGNMFAYDNDGVLVATLTLTVENKKAFKKNGILMTYFFLELRCNKAV